MAFPARVTLRHRYATLRKVFSYYELDAINRFSSYTCFRNQNSHVRSPLPENVYYLPCRTTDLLMDFQFDPFIATIRSKHCLGSFHLTALFFRGTELQ